MLIKSGLHINIKLVVEESASPAFKNYTKKSLQELPVDPALQCEEICRLYLVELHKVTQIVERFSASTTSI
jgi:hypothetical protein